MLLHQHRVFVDEDIDVGGGHVLDLDGAAIEEDVGFLIRIGGQQLVKTVIGLGSGTIFNNDFVAGTVTKHLAIFGSVVAHAVVLREGQHGQVTIEGLRERTVPSGQSGRFALNVVINNPLVQHTQQAVPNHGVVANIFVRSLYIADRLVFSSGNLVVAIQVSKILDALYVAVGTILLKR